MPYFKNSELAYTYHVSDRTVRNWVALAKEGKLPLELEMLGDKAYVAKTSGNIKIIEEYVARNKAKRPSSAHRVVVPRKKFYSLFTQSQVYDIVRNLEMHHEIPRQYNYFDGGADEWDTYIKYTAKQSTASPFHKTVELLSESLDYLDRRLAKYDQVNIVDVGAGNGLPVLGLLKHFIKQGKLGRYVAIDISPEMLEIAERNIKNAIEMPIEIEKYEMDATHERFTNILAESYLRQDKVRSANLVLLLGGTHVNLRNPNDMFRTIQESMSMDDCLIYTEKLATEDTRPEWFKLNSNPGKLELAPIHRLVFDLLSIDRSFYDVEMGYDERLNQQYTRTRLKVALTLKFEFDEGERIIEFEKGDTILLWRAWQMTLSSITSHLIGNGFYTMHSTQTEDQTYILTVSQAKSQK